jgi:hypothetical protein
MPARIHSIKVARRYNIRCRICPEIGDEFPRAPANFSPSRSLEAGVQRGSQAPRFTRFAQSRGDKKRAARRRENPNEGTVISAPGRRAWQHRPYVSDASATSGGVPAGASNVRPSALLFIPECCISPAKTRNLASLRAHHVVERRPRHRKLVSVRGRHRSLRRPADRDRRRRRCW